MTSQLQELVDECPSDRKCAWNFLYKTTGNFKDLPIYRCKNCLLQALHPRPSQKEIYDEEYYTGKAEYSYIDERESESFHAHVWDARIKNILKFTGPGVLLDVGSSFGGFLRRAKQFGFTVQGVEYSSFSGAYANQNGIPTFIGKLTEVDFPKESFDVITMVEVLEHLENPREVFATLGRLLKKGGLLLIQTANFEGLQAVNEGAQYHYYLPGHLYYYCHQNLVQFLERVGFTKFNPYFGVDFPLMAKLLKARGDFQKVSDYQKWFKISLYHILSKMKKDGKPVTSSYVLYATKG